jgi:PIN domain nuclease of toxin-antitoxin system
MKLLLDSHTFIWSYAEKYKLSPTALSEMSKLSNQLYLSIVSIWEIQIKIQAGKFKFDRPFAEIIAEQEEVNGLHLLPINPSHIFELENLPPHHRDPFDRLLISQAMVEGMTLVSFDKHFTQYKADLLW